HRALPICQLPVECGGVHRGFHQSVSHSAKRQSDKEEDDVFRARQKIARQRQENQTRKNQLAQSQLFTPESTEEQKDDRDAGGKELRRSKDAFADAKRVEYFRPDDSLRTQQNSKQGKITQ